MDKKQRLKSENVKITTPEFRVSFPAVFEPRAAKEGDRKRYSLQMLFRVKETPASKEAGEKVVDIKQLKDAVRAVVEEKFGTDRTKWPPIAQDEPKIGQLHLPFRDGNAITHKDKAGYGEGVIFATAGKDGRQVRPGIVHAHAGPDGRPAPLTIPSDFYGGCYARATINPYYWEYMGKFGVALGLQNVQKLRDGEPFGGGEAAAEAFEPIDVPEGKLAETAAGGDGTGL